MWVSEVCKFYVVTPPSGLDMVPDPPLPGAAPRLSVCERFALIILFCLSTIFPSKPDTGGVKHK